MPSDIPRQLEQQLNGVEASASDLITLTRHIFTENSALGDEGTGDLMMLLIGIQVIDHSG
jgi:hypothetical protein